MTGFKLDTSGSVRADIPGLSCPVFWDDLSPFAQGYVEAAWEAVRELRRDAEDGRQMNLGDLGFRHLAPATLAAMLEDCEALTAPETFTFANTAEAGAYCWRMRQEGWPMATGGPVLRERFPPIHLSLADDGKIHQRPAPPQTEGEG